ANGDAEHAVAVALLEILFLERLELADQIAGVGVPELQALVEAAGNDLLAVGGPGDAVHGGGLRLRVRVDLAELLGLADIPDADRAVVATRGELRAAGVERDRIDKIGMREVLSRRLGSELPGAGGLVEAAGIEEGIVRGKGERRGGRCMGEALHRLAELRGDRLARVISDVPGNDRLVVARRSQDQAVGREPQAAHRARRLERANL